MPETQPIPFLQEDEMETSITYLIHRVSHSYAAQSVRLMKGINGLGLTEWRVLFYLAYYGKASPTDIARRAALDKSQLSKSIAGMVRKKLVTLDTDPNDLRYKLVEMTPAGVAAYNAVCPILQKRRRAVLDGLSEEEIATVRSALQLINRQCAEVEEGLQAELDALEPADANVADPQKETANATT